MSPFNLKVCENIVNEDPVYDLEDVKKAVTRLVEIDENHWLAVLEKDEVNIEYALFDFHHSDDITTRVSIVFQGYGTGASLKEMRHTYFGSDGAGYVFYLPIDATIKALTVLKEYFE